MCFMYMTLFVGIVVIITVTFMEFSTLPIVILKTHHNSELLCSRVLNPQCEAVEWAVLKPAQRVTAFWERWDRWAFCVHNQLLLERSSREPCQGLGRCFIWFGANQASIGFVNACQSGGYRKMQDMLMKKEKELLEIVCYLEKLEAFIHQLLVV